MTELRPRKPVPQLSLPTVGAHRLDLATVRPETFIMLVFYRGYHCPICKKQLTELENNLDRLAEFGVEPIAISMDDEERARKSKEEWNLDRLTVAYGLSEDEARSYGLYISEAISDAEPDCFSEPGTFLVKPDGTLYGAIIQTMPFSRPSLDQLIKGIEYYREKGYPARGNVAQREAV